MNYRHAFHAGNFADCMKHALLLAILGRLRRKPAPFVVLDTHAGTGATPLDGPEATRTGEWRAGIGRLLEATPAPLAPFVEAVRAAGLARGTYPGSPLLARDALRAEDRLVACELHPEDAALLRANLGGDPRCAVHHRDGYAALRALLPAREAARGLVLIDPPFEATDEWARLAEAVRIARARMPTAIVAAWYPIKGRAPSRAFAGAVAQAGVRDVVAYELLLRPPLDAARLDGCGLLVANGPFGLETEAETLLAALADVLAETRENAVRIERVAGE